MPSPLVRALWQKHGLPLVDEQSIDAFLTPAEQEVAFCLLFFTGDPEQQAETDDVAVIFPQLLKTFHGRLRGAILTRAAEPLLKERFHVYALPSLVVTRGNDVLASLPKVRDWSEYLDKISACLVPEAPVLQGRQGPKTEIVLPSHTSDQEHHG